MNYYNEFNPKAAAALRQLIKDGFIPEGVVDERSITDINPDELRGGYDQCHFFAGIGGWSYALQLADWPADRPVWTGSCPCQPFSSAGKQKGKEDERHLWPIWLGLIRECRPPVIFGEQVAAAIAHGWMDEVAHDLEEIDYAIAAAVVPACSVGAPHRRDRLWFMADSNKHRCNSSSIRRASQERNSQSCRIMGAAQHTRSHGEQVTRGDGTPIPDNSQGQNSSSKFKGTGQSGYVSREFMADSNNQRPQGRVSRRENPEWENQHGYAGCSGTTDNFWGNTEWSKCADGKQRPTQPGIRLLANGVPERVGLLHAAGNAIVPQVAAQIIRIYREITE